MHNHNLPYDPAHLHDNGQRHRKATLNTTTPRAVDAAMIVETSVLKFI